ncbi:dihydropteroate synthase [Candidatus Nitrosocosmicus franklandus]|uniref:dihydropteroate synthase n=1 Tax=Candidatus Nitrosocosmicus franklandianus TaxID=1798806 RepID=A0A484ID99_9ARCH|nr:dihydropteroate synthase [Candidatus Nitrosocosmicus franklandus]VFJ14199.1 Dihydropteroate synthase [Candidatus Nitrosocosmicus franklandus]
MLTTIGNTSIHPDEPVKIMGIINVSPESFYQNSIKRTENEIQDTLSEMEASGVDIIDVGGMSTAPYLRTIIPVELEIKRLFNAVSAIRQISDIPISIDTPRSDVVRSLLKLEINAINDVTGLKYDTKMSKLAYENDLPIIIGAHISNNVNSYYSGDVHDTLSLIRDSITIAQKSNIDLDNMIVDPSIGFFRQSGNSPFFSRIKGMEWYIRDLEILSNIEMFKSLSIPLCVSISRKSFIQSLFGLNVEDRLIPSIISEVHCAIHGASLIRTHNVKETRQALDMLNLLRE